MNEESIENIGQKKRNHLVVVGFDDIVCNKYLPCIEEAISSKFIDSYSIIELKSQKINTEEKISHIKLKPANTYYLPEPRRKGVYADLEDFEPIFREIKQGRGKLKVYIATELKAHEDYLKYCIENNIDSLVEKPILAPMRNGQFDPSLIESAMYHLVNEAKKKSAKHSVMTLSRYHKIYNERVLKPLGQKMIELNAPLTSFHLRHSGGVWNLHKEYESREDHHQRTERFFGSQNAGRAKRVPLISPHFSKRIWSTAFGGAHCFFAKKQVRAKDFFGNDLFRKKVVIPCDSVKVLCVFYPFLHRFEPIILLL